MSQNALDFINRLKAEIERLKHLEKNVYEVVEELTNKIKAEAVNELIEKLTEEYKDYMLADSVSINRIFLSIKHFAKRMEGEG